MYRQKWKEDGNGGKSGTQKMQFVVSNQLLEHCSGERINVIFRCIGRCIM